MGQHHRITIRRFAAVAITALLAGVGTPVAAQTDLPARTPETELVLFLGGGSWLPMPETRPEGLRGHHGGRILLGLQLERSRARDASWAWIGSAIAGAPGPDGDDNIDPESGVLVDAALVRRLNAPGRWIFAYGGGGLGLAFFDKTWFAPGLRAGVGLGTVLGLRAEGRYQYLVGAGKPHGYAALVGAHVRW